MQYYLKRVSDNQIIKTDSVLDYIFDAQYKLKKKGVDTWIDWDKDQAEKNDYLVYINHRITAVCSNLEDAKKTIMRFSGDGYIIEQNRLTKKETCVFKLELPF